MLAPFAKKTKVMDQLLALKNMPSAAQYTIPVTATNCVEYNNIIPQLIKTKKVIKIGANKRSAISAC